MNIGKYTTRDGRPARVYATDGQGIGCNHGAILTSSGWGMSEWDKYGVSYPLPRPHLDLVAEGSPVSILMRIKAKFAKATMWAYQLRYGRSAARRSVVAIGTVEVSEEKSDKPIRLT
jgi:hypothetical protein